MLIATHWRACDIVAEMARDNIPHSTVLVEHQGQLCDYHAGNHPFQIPGGERPNSMSESPFRNSPHIALPTGGTRAGFVPEPPDAPLPSPPDSPATN
ncbi:MAG: hypothetical protein QGG36_10330 [Pirellulaceae bacterium]|nr:hypothetical protein [Pirellulaceae bacterium]MDP7016187.1 hypothetical protein [Pirellulaceae bacterium]